MRTMSGRFDRDHFLPDDIGGALRRRLGEITGLVLLALSVIIALALATWSVQDPSLSHATSAPVRNLLGSPGAIVVRSADPALRPRRHRASCCRSRSGAGG